jgi:lysophospholipase L1-like esterase
LLNRRLLSKARAIAFPALGLALLAFALAYLALNGVRRTILLPVANAVEDGGSAYFLPRVVLDHALVPERFRGAFEAPTDTLDARGYSIGALFESGHRIGPPHSLHAAIRSRGTGAFSHWSDGLRFSATDNTDVRMNRRQYEFRATVRLAEPYRGAAKRLMALSLVFAGVIALGLILSGDVLRLRLILSRLWWPFVLIAVAAGLGAISLLTFGVVFVALTAFSCSAGVVGLVWATAALLPGRAGSVVQKRVGSFALVAGSLAVGLVAVEGGLRLLEVLGTAPAPAQKTPDDQPRYEEAKDEAFQSLPTPLREGILARHSLLSLPDSWRMRQVAEPGAAYAYYWHGVLHLHDENSFRRSKPLPARDPTKLRIVVLGDSFTYGYGIEEDWTYARILERKLKEKREVEVINLGVSGHQSEDIARVLEKFYEQLQPDLVIYGICQNDFLDSGEGQHDGRGISLPKFLTERAKVASILEYGINAGGRTLGLMPDFYDQVLDNIKNYEPRFSKDLHRMNDFVRQKSGRPVTAMVLDQFPITGAGSRSPGSLRKPRAAPEWTWSAPTTTIASIMGRCWRSPPGKATRTSGLTRFSLGCSTATLLLPRRRSD